MACHMQALPNSGPDRGNDRSSHDKKQRSMQCSDTGVKCKVSVTVFLGILMLTIASVGAQDPLDHLGVKEEPRTYLLPITRFGPSNQRRDLRYMIGIADQLKAGLLLTGLFKHYSDVLKARREAKAAKQLSASLDAASGVPALATNTSGLRQCFNQSPEVAFLPFDLVLDRTPITSWVPAMTPQELKATGWDGRIVAIMHRKALHHQRLDIPKHINKTLAATGSWFAQSLHEIPVKDPVWCKASRIQKLRDQIAPFRVVAVVTFILDDSWMPWYHQIMGRTPMQPCRAALHKAEQSLRPAPWIQQTAKAFIQQQLGGEPFLAVHARPYPDACMKLFQKEVLDRPALSSACYSGLGQLDQTLSTKIPDMMTEFNLWKVVVIAHPSIRQHITNALSQSNVTIHWVSEEVVYNLAGCQDPSASFLLMVESEIAVQADAFLGTAISSITHAIVSERASLQKVSTVRFIPGSAIRKQLDYFV